MRQPLPILCGCPKRGKGQTGKHQLRVFESKVIGPIPLQRHRQAWQTRRTV